MATTSQQQREIDHATELGSLSLLQYPQPLIVQGRFSLLPALCTFYTTFLLYPSLFTFFVTVSIVLSIFSALGGGAILNWLSVTYARNPVAPGDGFSLTNWTDPDVFNSFSTQNSLVAARFTLSGQLPTTFPPVFTPPQVSVDYPPGETRRVFDINVAKVLTIMTALVYERVDQLVYASKFAAQASALLPGAAQQTLVNNAITALQQSERKINDQAARWGLAYEGISDLATLSGPFASIFYTRLEDVARAQQACAGDQARRDRTEDPFIVLVLKGTTPFNYAEFVVNGTVSKTSAATFLGAGQAHEGYFSSIFDSNKIGADGYGQIVKSLKSIGAELSVAAGGRRIPLWIAGHSLGGCLASLLFARFLHMPADLGPDLVLKDCYNVGTLRVADAALADHFEGTLIAPTDRPSILWRLVMPYDFGPRITPGFADDERNRNVLPAMSPLNWAHLSSCTITSPSFQHTSRWDRCVVEPLVCK